MWRYAHLALQNHNIDPEEFMKFPVRKKAFYVASDELQAEVIRNLK